MALACKKPVTYQYKLLAISKKQFAFLQGDKTKYYKLVEIYGDNEV